MAFDPLPVALFLALTSTSCGQEPAAGAPSAVVAEPAAASSSDSTVAPAGWAQWRGPLGTGFAPGANPPTRWSESENVRFKTRIPGFGYGSPVVWEDQIFLTTAIPVGEPLPPVPDNAPGAHDNAVVRHRHEFVALAVNRVDGSIAWQTKLHEQLPHAGFHKSGALAAASAVTDGKHVIAYFGSYGVFCLNTSGEVLWSKDLGDMQIKHGHGEGCTPALHDGTVIITWDHEGPSFVVALDASTGEERWRQERDEPTSWATPVVALEGGKAQVIVSGTNRIRAYDLADGTVVWDCVGLSNNVVATPIAADGWLYAGSSYVRKRMMGIRTSGAKGDISMSDHVAWRRQRGTPYVPSPLLQGDWLYFLNHYQGFLTRVEAHTGNEPARPMRLAGMNEIYASPVGVEGRVYITDRSGVTLVVSDAPNDPKVLAQNRLEDSISASAAIVGDAIYLRGAQFLYGIGGAAAESSGD